jgi:hypothetical protein
MTIYERITKAMQDEDTDYVSMLITDDGIEVFTSLESDDLMVLLMSVIVQEKEVSRVH